MRLRHEVLPLLDDVLGGGVRPALARTAELMAQDLEALDEIAGAVLRAGCPGRRFAGCQTLAAQPAAVIGRVLRSWAAVGGAGPLSYDHLQRMGRQVRDRPGPAQVRLPGGFDVLLDGDVRAADPPGRCDRSVRPAPPSGLTTRNGKLRAASTVLNVRPTGERRDWV